MVVTSKYGHSSTVSLEVQGWRPIVLKATGCVQVLSFDVLGLLELRESVRDRAGPINGGLFLGSEAVSGLTDVRRFAVSQDQHNTVRARVRFQASRRMWVALSGQYGSGLPSDIGSTDPEFLLAQYGEAILHRVDLDRGRVRPSFSLDAAMGMEVYRKEQRSASFQIQTSNATDRVNVINFASLFFRYSRCPATKRFGALKADLLKVIAFAETVPETFDLERSKSSSVHRCGTVI